MAEIRVFHSHIEVYPYIKGDKPEIERLMSTYNSKTHEVCPIGYFIQNDILYLPRGMSTTLLSDKFNAAPTIVRECDTYTGIRVGRAKYKPKSIMQEHAIQFLCAEEQFSYTGRYSQLGLNLQTGDGKTYAAVYAILKYKIKAIIVTHQEKIKRQWMKTFKEMTTLPPDKMINITGIDGINNIMNGAKKGDVYLVNHQTIEAYAKLRGWTAVREFFKKIKVGIKVIDEAHKFFEDTLMIDNFSNCYKSFYLTATFGRGGVSNNLYRRCFSSLTRFGEETINYDEKRKHTNFVIVYYTSRPQNGFIPDLRTYYGFSSYKFIDYELHKANGALLVVLEHLLDKTKHLDGKTLIFTPTIQSVEDISKYVEEKTGREVGIIHSKRSPESVQEALDKDIICTTIKSAGEGLDIKKLRILICLEPIGSSNLADQVRGRLREFSPKDDTYMFYIVDTAVRENVNYLNRILPTMKKKCKEITTLKLNA